MAPAASEHMGRGLQTLRRPPKATRRGLGLGEPQGVGYRAHPSWWSVAPGRAHSQRGSFEAQRWGSGCRDGPSVLAGELGQLIIMVPANRVPGRGPWHLPSLWRGLRRPLRPAADGKSCWAALLPVTFADRLALGLGSQGFPRMCDVAELRGCPFAGGSLGAGAPASDTGA